jgi:hypothetical protein
MDNGRWTERRLTPFTYSPTHLFLHNIAQLWAFFELKKNAPKKVFEPGTTEEAKGKYPVATIENQV